MAVIEIDVVPDAAGKTAKLIGFGVGAVVSGNAFVVADVVADAAVVFWLLLTSRAWTVKL